MERLVNRMVILLCLLGAVSYAHAQPNTCSDFPDWPCEPLPAFAPAQGVDCDEPGNGPGDFFPGFPTDLTALTEFAPGQTYGGLQGRLYVEGSTPTNIPPPALDDHLQCMSEQIGAGDLADDPIVFMTMGTSTTNQHGSVAQLMAQQMGIQSDRVVWVNGAMAGWDLCGANDDWADMFGFQKRRLEAAGIVAEPGDVFPQVQVVWIRWAITAGGCGGVPPTFPDNAGFYRDELKRMVYENLLVQYPNLRVIYFSSAPTRGYINTSLLCYEMAWGVRMLIEDHVNNLDTNACDPRCTAADVDDPLCEGPALAWGPYLWVNGNCLADPEETIDGRLNGVDYSSYFFNKEHYETDCKPDWSELIGEAICGWDCEAWQNPDDPPGCNPHVSPVGEQKVASLFLDFLQNNKHTALWYPVQSDETTGRRTLAATDDGWTDEAAPTAPGANGDTRYLITSPGGNNDAKHVFMKFKLPADMAPSGLLRVGLMLMVGQKDTRLGSIYYTTDPDDNSWTESVLDWDWESAHINLADLPSIDMPETGGRGAMVNLDVTTIIHDAITAAADDITFIYVGGSECAAVSEPGCTLNAGEIHEHEVNLWDQTDPYAGPRLFMVTRCAGDANRDGQVDPLDGGFVLARFGCSVGTGDPECNIADMNGDGLVDPLDVGFILARFGECQ